jgi:hypothetical protein
MAPGHLEAEGQILAHDSPAGCKFDPLAAPLSQPRGQAGALVNRRAFLGSLAGGLLTAPLAAEAEQVGKVYRIGWLTPAAGGRQARSGPG